MKLRWIALAGLIAGLTAGYVMDRLLQPLYETLRRLP